MAGSETCVANAQMRWGIEKAGGTGGFTLVEMLVALAIVGLAASVAVQFTGSGSGRRVGRITASLSAEIGLLRAQALRSGQTARLVFDSETGRFLSSRIGAAPISTAPLPVLVETGDASGTTSEIRFLPDGGASGGRIVIGSPRDQQVLSVSRLIARVRRQAAR